MSRSGSRGSSRSVPRWISGGGIGLNHLFAEGVVRGPGTEHMHRAQQHTARSRGQQTQSIAAQRRPLASPRLVSSGPISVVLSERNKTKPSSISGGGSVLGLCFDACMMISLMIAERTNERTNEGPRFTAYCTTYTYGHAGTVLTSRTAMARRS